MPTRALSRLADTVGPFLELGRHLFFSWNSLSYAYWRLQISGHLLSRPYPESMESGICRSVESGFAMFAVRPIETVSREDQYSEWCGAVCLVVRLPSVCLALVDAYECTKLLKLCFRLDIIEKFSFLFGVFPDARCRRRLMMTAGSGEHTQNQCVGKRSFLLPVTT